ncbi:MAG: hypothetical protein N4J56_002837 [Chroococcidiopsis sp. SAG 2025]|uniref:hypothetical protein n=1 Tax=Chroococcidiopsis sp. SAG 2025 TaxID=171389 RepID=UPI002936F71E|nr:hypothetical protein [Chroococcidiopsis sp. SAG 2025]MDV2993183.1 hypothetical protein [Chroococcidiopsis sp. SAG 2025]
MNVLEKQRALLPEKYRDKFVYCSVTDEERAVRLMADWMYRAQKYLKRPMGDDIEADIAEIERREQKCFEAQMSLPAKIRGYELLTGERLLKEFYKASP